MSLTDTFRKKRNRPASGADPAQAFGAEEQTMEEIRRQTFVPPEKKGPGFVQRAGTALSSLRTRIVGQEPEEDFGDYYEAPQPPMEEAPIYAGENAQSENAPDLGWENPFTDPAPRSQAPAPERRTRSAAPGREAAPPTYTYPQEPAYAPVYPEAPPSYAPYQTPAEPFPEEVGEPYPRESYVPEADFYGGDPRYAPPAEDWGPGPYAEPAYDYREPPIREMDDGAWYGTDNLPPPRRVSRPQTDPGDFKYMFWSGGIVLSMFLTLVAFVYGCVV